MLITSFIISVGLSNPAEQKHSDWQGVFVLKRRFSLDV